MEENPYRSPGSHSGPVEPDDEDWALVDYDEVDDWTILKSLLLPAAGFIAGIFLAWYAVSR